MAVTAEDIKMRIIAENAADRAVKQFSTSIKNVDKGVGKLSGSLKALGGIAAGAFAVQGFRALSGAIGAAVQDASDLQETTGKFDVVFRGVTESAYEMADNIAGGYAMSKNEAMSFMASMQDMLKPMGMVADEAAVMSGDIVKLSADLGSFNNLPTADVMRDIQSAMVGNYETVRKYGTMISAASVEQSILKKGLAETKDEITPLMKAQEVYTMIVGNNADAVGDMARTQDSFANRSKQLKANISDLSATLGGAVLESGALDRVFDALNPAVDEFTEYIADHKEDIGDFAAHLGNMAGDAIKNAPGYIEAITTNIKGLYDAVVPLVDLVAENPEMAKYGIIGGLLFGPAGAALGGTMGYMKQVGDNVDKAMGGSPWEKFLSELEDLEAQKQAWQEYSSGVRETEMSQEQMLAETLAKMASAADKTAGSTNKVGDASSKAAREAMAWEKALKAAKKSLDGTNDEILSVADSTTQLELAEQALKTAMLGGIKNRKAVEDATKDHDKATKAAAKSVAQYEEETNAANKAILSAQKFMRKHGETLEKHGISTDRMTDLQRALAEEYRRKEPRIERIIELQRLLGLEIDNTANIMSDSVRAYQNATADIVDAVGQIGVVFAESAGISIAGIGVLQDAIQHLQGDGTPGSENDLLGYLGIANFVGQNIGGSVGGVISSTAGMASAGASLATALGASTGNPIGAIIGGAVGLISSIFGGGDYEEERAAREEARTETYNTLVGLANEGGLYSRALIQAGGGTYQGLSDLVPDADLERRLGREFGGNRLLADYGHGRAEEIAREASAIDSYFITVHESINNALGAASVEEGADALRQNIQGQLEYALQQVVVTSLMDEALLPAMLPIINEMRGVIEAEGTISQEQIARYRAQAESVVDMTMPVFEAAYGIFGNVSAAAEAAASALDGFAADSLASAILQSFALAENEGGNIGDTFVSNFTASIEDGLMNFAASQLVENVLSGMMEPVMASIAEAFSSAQMVSASLIESSMAQITAIAKQAAPYVESLYEAFGGSIKAVVPTVRYSSGGGSAASARSKDGFADAIRNLESFRAGMFADAKIAPGNIGALQAQQSAVRTLVAQARQGADEDSRIAAMRDLPGAVSSSLQSALAMTADPLEYSRQVGEMSNMLAGVTGGRDATLRNVVTEIRELRRENEQLRETMAQLLDSGNENTDKLVSLTREMVENSD